MPTNNYGQPAAGHNEKLSTVERVPSRYLNATEECYVIFDTDCRLSEGTRRIKLDDLPRRENCNWPNQEHTHGCAGLIRIEVLLNTTQHTRALQRLQGVIIRQKVGLRQTLAKFVQMNLTTPKIPAAATPSRCPSGGDLRGATGC